MGGEFGVKKLANQSAGWWLFLGVTSTVVLLIKLWDIERYVSNIVLIPSIVGAVLGYGIALAIAIARKIQNNRLKKEQSKLES